MGALHRPPQDADRFYLDFPPIRRRTVQRRGISLSKLTASDEALSTSLAKPRKRFVARCDPRDMSQAYPRDHDGVYRPIP